MLRTVSTIVVLLVFVVAGHGAETKWRDEVVPVELGVGYAVRILDLSGDGKLDIAIVDSKRFIWLENPTWNVHVMHEDPKASFDNVCFAPHDIDGDDDTDFAVGRDWQFGNSDSGGHIGWLRCPENPRDSWEYIHIMEEPTTHRMNWMDWNRDGRQELIVVPLKGRGSRPPGFDNTAIRMLMLVPSVVNKLEPTKVDWDVQVLDESLHVSHNIDVVDFDSDGHQDLLAASFEGVTWFRPDGDRTVATRLGTGQAGTAPAIGASEIRLGRLDKTTSYLATIEPWHGDKVIAYTPPANNEPNQLWTRHVLDEQLKWGHAVACANLDDDEAQELVIGVRDEASAEHRCGVRIYDPVNPSKGEWSRSLIAPGQVAVEDLVLGDLDDDGDNEIVAVGRATHNVVIYWND
jgi:hypothetical protein